jgi:hypothetical protein
LEAYWPGESFGEWRAEDESLRAWRVSEKAQRRIGWRRRKAIGVEGEMEVEGQRSGLPDWRVNASITSRWYFVATTDGGLVEGARIKITIGRHEACTSMTLSPVENSLASSHLNLRIALSRDSRMSIESVLVYLHSILALPLPGLSTS